MRELVCRRRFAGNRSQVVAFGPFLVFGLAPDFTKAMVMTQEQARGAAVPDIEDARLRRKRALYRAQHRGTKEMDWMIGRYATAQLDDMSIAALGAFESFLEVGDPTLNAWLLDPSSCSEVQFAGLIDDIRRFNSLS